MRFTLNDQMVCFLFALLTGVLTGVVYELFRIMGKTVFSGAVAEFICDFLFFVFFTFVTVFFSMGFSRGYTRYFTVFGEVFGFLLFHFTIGRVSCRGAEILVYKIKAIFAKILIKSKKMAKRYCKQHTIYCIINLIKEDSFFQKRNKVYLECLYLWDVNL